MLHKGGCPVWATGGAGDCTCNPTPVPTWRIRPQDDAEFPWRVFRWTGDACYEPLLRCSTFDGAVALVESFKSLEKNPNV